MKFLRSAAAQVIGLFVSDWVQTVVILAIVAAGWLAISVLHVTPIAVLVALVLLLAAQHVWFALAEARRASRPQSPSPSPS
ncbi:MAG TPA: hypothetical protein VIO37_04400 [Candidatus Dormibacteraeota bacterium]